MTITPEQQAKLREKFPIERIGKKPKITCRACSNAPTRVCNEHKKKSCPPAPNGCGQWMTEKHMHVEFVGHANVTDRLLEVDPGWTWEPMAFGQDGLPALDANGGLWIRLTVAGVTRIGYGAADGKKGEDAVKEAIGDAIKIAAMRFGVGLDLWRKEEASGKAAEEESANGQVVGRGQAPAQQQDTPAAARARLHAACRRHGWDEQVVADKFAERYPDGLGAETDPARIDKFREWLTSRPQHELDGAQPAAANGAPR